jgi:hypothetical protein
MEHKFIDELHGGFEVVDSEPPLVVGEVDPTCARCKSWGPGRGLAPWWWTFRGKCGYRLEWSASGSNRWTARTTCLSSAKSGRKSTQLRTQQKLIIEMRNETCN